MGAHGSRKVSGNDNSQFHNFHLKPVGNGYMHIECTKIHNTDTRQGIHIQSYTCISLWGNSFILDIGL